MKFRSSNTISITQVRALCGPWLLYGTAELRGSEWPSPGKSRRQAGTRTKAGSETASQRPSSAHRGTDRSTLSFRSILQKKSTQWMGILATSASLMHRIKLPLCGEFRSTDKLQSSYRASSANPDAVPQSFQDVFAHELLIYLPLRSQLWVTCSPLPMVTHLSDNIGV